MLRISYLRGKWSKSKKTYSKIWSVRKKAVPLQPISQWTQVSENARRKSLRMVMLKISHLQRKWQNNAKKLLKNLVSPKKSSTFAADFATNENSSEKQWSLKVWLINNVVQESSNAQLGNWKRVIRFLLYGSR